MDLDESRWLWVTVGSDKIVKVREATPCSVHDVIIIIYNYSIHMYNFYY